MHVLASKWGDGPGLMLRIIFEPASASQSNLELTDMSSLTSQLTLGPFASALCSQNCRRALMTASHLRGCW